MPEDKAQDAEAPVEQTEELTEQGEGSVLADIQRFYERRRD